jgi:integrase
MSVFKLKDAKSRTLPWRAVVFRQGQSRLTKMFPTRQEAEMFESHHKQAERLKGIPEYEKAKEHQNFSQKKVKDVIQDYITDNPSMSNNNLVTLKAFLREPIVEKNLLEFSKQDVNRFIAKRKKDTWKVPNWHTEAKPITPRTIRRQLRVLSGAFRYAIEMKDGFEHLPNHFQGLRIEGSTGGRRKRSLRDGELERIMEACQRLKKENKYWIPLAIHLAINTGMRRGEIFNLRWCDIDDVNRRIRIRKSKTDKATGNQGATIVLPAIALHMLVTLAMIRHDQYKLPTTTVDGKEYFTFPQDNELIFPMTAKAFEQAWEGVRENAGIEDLHFHDLRREANDRFYRAGLTIEEREMMLRHSNRSMESIYRGEEPLLRIIQDKLDRYALGGMTYNEAYEKGRVDFPEAKQLHLPIEKEK